MSLSIPIGPIQAENITFSDSQTEKLGRYHLEKVDNITAEWKSNR